MSVNVTVVNLGKTEKLELGDGATYGDAASKIENLESVSARNSGVDIREKAAELIEDGATITITPKSLKNG